MNTAYELAESNTPSTVLVQLSLLQRDWCERAAEQITKHFKLGQEFTSDDLHTLIEPPEHPNWWGVALARCKNKWLIERIGYQVSTRLKANGRPVAVWKMV